jgi:cell division protein DivIC
MSRKIAFRKRRQNRLGMILVSMVVLMLLGVITLNSLELRATSETYLSQKEELLSKIEDEKMRTEEIEEYEKYTQTKKYIEEIAKDKLGLVYDNEIIFKKGD